VLLNVVIRGMRCVFFLCFDFRVSCLGMEIALATWLSISVWEYPRAENCCLSLFICCLSSLSSVQILLSLIASE